GYQGVDVFVFLVAFFSTRFDGKLRGFADRWAGRRGASLAALAGRKQFASQSSLSRALDSVTGSQAADFAKLLLREVLDWTEILHHPSVQTVECGAHSWHFFVFDPTATGMRQRALAIDEDLPHPRREGEDLAAPGYLGRKRGEVKL